MPGHVNEPLHDSLDEKLILCILESAIQMNCDSVSFDFVSEIKAILQKNVKSDNSECEYTKNNIDWKDNETNNRDVDNNDSSQVAVGLGRCSRGRLLPTVSPSKTQESFLPTFSLSPSPYTLQPLPLQYAACRPAPIKLAITNIPCTIINRLSIIQFYDLCAILQSAIAEPSLPPSFISSDIISNNSTQYYVSCYESLVSSPKTPNAILSAYKLGEIIILSEEIPLLPSDEELSKILSVAESDIVETNVLAVRVYDFIQIVGGQAIEQMSSSTLGFFRNKRLNDTVIKFAERVLRGDYDLPNRAEFDDKS
ncbi:7195_t:CDS:2 [Paraglomus occultum]|uniref:7195_t:CDS:1 n=1 Tax=Paraglomus occultum TaxID=144539 RepID=A0A9N8YYN0_9GLOM|nr:7195_t:CDS:2 [Paraglomus occultum]